MNQPPPSQLIFSTKPVRTIVPSFATATAVALALYQGVCVAGLILFDGSQVLVHSTAPAGDSFARNDFVWNFPLACEPAT